ncbi:MAG: LPS export ABC transporter periplasmic protein LptC [Ignavibacteriales bacterium]|nr:MAG: LPS export ABC transporter periplasmic protein LptC [Ignavibacteriaceae bacterium]MBW7873656.1 LPS export ABC transporter periplasmic protein LptC [Ignavibacteria bacterium]MCZ2143886.1 LPS export ABC transporter periplasmic protein LptC [Ignavibacteriales bacterium]OQY72568.1 MAG: LPS export ABC transporter periplasmic protein LptC [Ignavibacteriales bacterium UTCHB3]MBV6445843.1 Lipopolysaccharide export system protein LptC [Ignavibacteriaceae bacterium]
MNHKYARLVGLKKLKAPVITVSSFFGLKFLTALFLAALFLAGCGGQEKITPAKIGLKGETPDQQSFNSTITFTDSGKVMAVLTAGVIKVFYSRNYTLLEKKIKVDFYNEKGKNDAVLTGDNGKVDDVTKDIQINKDVVVKNDRGMTLNTEKLMWRNSDRKIWTDEFVKIKTATEEIEGYGFESDQSLKNYTIFKVTLITDGSALKGEK